MVAAGSISFDWAVAGTSLLADTSATNLGTWASPTLDTDATTAAIVGAFAAMAD